MRSGSATKINKIYLLSVRLTISKKIILALVCYPHLSKTTERLGHHDGSSKVISRSLKRDRDYSNSLTLTNENRTLPQLNLYEPYPSSKRERACFHAGRKILAQGRPLKADHPRTICFLYSVYMQWVLLVPSARIFLC